LTACAVSTNAQIAQPPAIFPDAGFDLDAAWQLHPQVSVRPERFGALLYHFGTRRLSFLKSPELLTVVSSLAAQPSARAACTEVGIGPADLPAYVRALATLAASQMICGRPDDRRKDGT
jgi:mycofactocin biosynthesis protein MftB